MAEKRFDLEGKRIRHPPGPSIKSLQEKCFAGFV